MVDIINFDQAYAAAFKSLNLEWLDQYNLTEEHDLLMLDNPREQIIQPGGFIFLAIADDSLVGTAALIKETDGVFELAKMVVAPAFRGKGISKLLLEKCLETARSSGAKKVILLSNSQLKNALSLYEKSGFEYIPVTDSHYATADIMMQIFL